MVRASVASACLMASACGLAESSPRPVRVGVLRKILASDAGKPDRFGASIAGQGQCALVGAWAKAGAVHAFQLEAGVWTRRQFIAANDHAPKQHFGHALAVDGDWACVGAPADATGGEKAGAAYVLHRDGSVWSEVQKLVPRDIAAGDNFGYSVDLAGNLAFVGAFLDDERGLDAGSVYVFASSPDGWREVKELFASDPGEGDAWFGHTVRAALGSGTAPHFVLIGAHNDCQAGEGAGAVYVFQREGATWRQSAKLIASDTEPRDRFGHAISLSRGSDGVLRALIGARYHQQSGTAYVFELGPEGWFEAARLRDPEGKPGEEFSWSVSLQGDLALCGALRAAPGGEAHLFQRTAGGWRYVARLAPDVPSPGAAFGISVCLLPASASGPWTAMVGAWQDGAAGPDAGALYTFSLALDPP